MNRVLSSPRFLSLLAALLAVFLLGLPEWEMRYRNFRTEKRPNPPQFITHTREVLRCKKPRTELCAYIARELFSQLPYTSGRSPDELELSFSEPIEILGFLASADIWKATRLVEFAAGLNQTPAYLANGADVFFHASFATNTEAGKIDEHVWFPHPFSAGNQDKLRIGAWIQNSSGSPQTVSPEFIVYYRPAQ